MYACKSENRVECANLQKIITYQIRSFLFLEVTYKQQCLLVCIGTLISGIIKRGETNCYLVLAVDFNTLAGMFASSLSGLRFEDCDRSIFTTSLIKTKGHKKWIEF